MIQSREEAIDLYMTYMDKVNRKGKDEFIKWLINDTDFFDDAPASGKFHNNCKFGLIDHSMNVLNYARNLYVFSKKNYPDFPDISGESIIICALHHDLCKVNFYGKQKAWTKHEYNWIEYEEYKAGKGSDNFNIGHGEKSVIMILRKGFELTEQEMLAIRFHMGSFSVYNEIDYENVKKDPLVYLIHLADMSSCMVEKTIDYKELAIKNYIKKITGGQ